MKETVAIDILITSRNRDRKVIQSTRITRRPLSSIKNRNQLASSDKNLTKEYL